jgi:hypothetical protein
MSAVVKTVNTIHQQRIVDTEHLNSSWLWQLHVLEGNEINYLTEKIITVWGNFR